MPRWCWPKPAGANPRALAESLAGKLAELDDVTGAEIAGPGFINLRVADKAWLGELEAIAALGADYGRSTMGAGRMVNVEYVSANPDRADAHGPLPRRGGGLTRSPRCSNMRATG